MADETLNIFNINYNNVKNINGGRISPQRDSIIRDSSLTEISKVISKHDRPDYISGKKTFNAVVVQDYSRSQPIAGTTLEGIKSAFGNPQEDNILQVRAVIPDVHDLVTPLPSDLSKESLRSDGEQQKFIKLAPIFQRVGTLNEPIQVGSIIEVEFTNNEYTEGKIVSVVQGVSIFDAALKSAKKAFDDAINGFSSLGDSGTQSGDGANETNLTTQVTGQCGGAAGYDLKDCITAPLTATGQNVTLHPDYWDKIDQLVTQIYNSTSEKYKITVGNSYRTVETQISTRKNKCPEWSLLLSDMSETEIMTMGWSSMDAAIAKKNGGRGCSKKTKTGAAYGNAPSRHTLGLAVDLKMDVECPSSGTDRTKWQNCRNTSKTYNYMKQYASSFGIKNLNDESEPWHWSADGG